jgi:anti-anti-sigma factor
MMTPPAAIKDISEQAFSAKCRHEGDAILVTLSGNADMAVHERLRSFLDQLHAEATATRVKEAVFAIHDLYFMNSSCLSLFLRLINEVLEPKALHRYSLRIRSNPNLRWQRRSFEAIRSYAQEIVVLE